MRALAYTRVSTDEQDTGLEVQRQAIEAECERRGWVIVKAVEEKVSARDLNRPGLQNALELLRDGEVDVLIAAKVDRLSRSVGDFAGLMERAQKEGWEIVALDLGMDSTTPTGRMMANLLASFSQYERELIGQRTKEALAVKKANGVRLGRPRELDDSTRRYVYKAREAGLSYQSIATHLNIRDVPTAHGGKKWWPETVRGIVQGEGG
jgi:DNA invertase Pin-like site-specific DNA recombinase